MAKKDKKEKKSKEAATAEGYTALKSKLSSCCDKLTKADLLAGLACVQTHIEKLPDEDDSVVVSCDKDDCVQQMMCVVGSAICTADQAAEHLLAMIECSNEDEDDDDDDDDSSDDDDE